MGRAGEVGKTVGGKGRPTTARQRALAPQRTHAWLPQERPASAGDARWQFGACALWDVLVKGAERDRMAADSAAARSFTSAHARVPRSADH